MDNISVGPEGSVIGVRGRKGVWKYHIKQQKWVKIGKFGFNVSVGPGGKPHILTKKGTLFWPEIDCPD